MTCEEKNCDAMPQFFLFCQSLASVLPKSFNIFLMLRFVGIKVFDKVCLVSPFHVLPCKFAQQHILLLDGMQLGIVMGNKACEEDRGQPDTEHDNPEPPLYIAVGKESTHIVPGQKKEQIARHAFQTCRVFRLGEEFIKKCFGLLQVTETQEETQYSQN